jgi:hypothetical protein
MKMITRPSQEDESILECDIDLSHLFDEISEFGTTTTSLTLTINILNIEFYIYIYIYIYYN